MVFWLFLLDISWEGHPAKNNSASTDYLSKRERGIL